MNNRQRLIQRYMLLIKPLPAEYVYFAENSEATSLYYIGRKTNITVPQRLEGNPVTTIGETTFNYSDATSITFPDGIEEIK